MRLVRGSVAGAPVVDVVGQLVEFAQAPGGQGGPAARTHRGGVVVELLSIAHEEVDDQEDQQEGRQQQIQHRHAPAIMGRSTVQHGAGRHAIR